MGLADTVSGAALLYCGKKNGWTLATPIGFGWLKCNFCGTLFRGIEDA